MSTFSVYDISRQHRAVLHLSGEYFHVEWPNIGLKQWDKYMLYPWDKITDVIIQQKKKLFGKDIIILVKVEKEERGRYYSNEYPAQTFYFRVKDERTATGIQDTIKQNIINYEKTAKERKEYIRKQEELKQQERNRQKELQELLINRYKTGDFDGVSPIQFEKIIGELFTAMGYKTKQVGGTGDQGIDLICTNQSINETIVIQS